MPPSPTPHLKKSRTSPSPSPKRLKKAKVPPVESPSTYLLRSSLPHLSPPLDLNLSPSELRLGRTLPWGQSFGWTPVVLSPPTSSSAWGTQDGVAFIGVIQDKLILLEETQDTVLATCVNDDLDADRVREYLNAGVDLGPLYAGWSKAAPKLFPEGDMPLGARVLKQDPWECLISFIMSSNNIIPKIARTLHKVRSRYGDLIATVNGVDFYAFPTPGQLADAGEGELREMGAGYRAVFIVETVNILTGRDRLSNLSESTVESKAKVKAKPDPDPILPKLPWLLPSEGAGYNEAKAALLSLPGVGSKVADCVLLFSLSFPSTVPVDTHVLRIAERDMGFVSELKSMTDTKYRLVQQKWVEAFGDYAGWAQNVLFIRELGSSEVDKQDKGAASVKKEKKG